MDAPAPAVLVVDDHDSVRAALAAMLKAGGYRRHLAASGPEAVEVLRRHGDEIGAALVDLHMPGMDGPATVAALHGVRPCLPCLLLSGGEITEADFCASGAVGVLAKPLAAHELCQAVQSLLDRRPAGAAPPTPAGGV
jgi:CheY-like chemotaxis protein